MEIFLISSSNLLTKKRFQRASAPIEREAEKREIRSWIWVPTRRPPILIEREREEGEEIKGDMPHGVVWRPLDRVGKRWVIRTSAVEGRGCNELRWFWIFRSLGKRGRWSHEREGAGGESTSRQGGEGHRKEKENRGTGCSPESEKNNRGRGMWPLRRREMEGWLGKESKREGGGAERR